MCFKLSGASIISGLLFSHRGSAACEAIFSESTPAGQPISGLNCMTRLGMRAVEAAPDPGAQTVRPGVGRGACLAQRGEWSGAVVERGCR
jgi:hypothetical protein